MSAHRPHIPADVKLKLWVLSGGRCEFPGCNKPVWRDGLTLKDDNFAHMAHIVAARPGGPRGNATQSTRLATDFANLMLVCLTHSKLVDGKHKKDYSITFLRDYKKRHEARIKMQTEVAPDMSTTVLRFVANVRERKMEISPSQADEAVAPRFPADETGSCSTTPIDLVPAVQRTGSSSLRTSPCMSHKRLLRQMTTAASSTFQSSRSLQSHSWCTSASASAAPLPSTFSRSRERPTIGNGKRSQVEARSNTSSPEAVSANRGNVWRLYCRLAVGYCHEVATVLAGAPRYEITIAHPGRDYLRYRSQLNAFATVYRQLLAEIRTRHGSECEVWLFPAVPVAVAVTCGRELLPKADPCLHVYDFDREQGGFTRTLTIN